MDLAVSFDLTVAWAILLAAAVFIYVALDGFDLGLGILYPFFPARRDRDLIMNTVAPVWDGNETWLVLGGGGLFAAFPLAYAILMPALYPPIIAMLLALVFRGVAFEFRWRTERSRARWDAAFIAGSTVAAFAQGVVLGAILQGVRIDGRAYAGAWWDWLSPFSPLCGAAVVSGYALLGATWLVMKTADDVQARAQRLAAGFTASTVAFIVAVSVVTPTLETAYWERWFGWPQVLFVVPVPLAVALLTLALVRTLRASGTAHDMAGERGDGLVSPAVGVASPDMASAQGGATQSSAADPAAGNASADTASAQGGALRSSGTDLAPRDASADVASAQDGALRSSGAGLSARAASADMASARGSAMRSSNADPATRVASADIASVQGTTLRSSATDPTARDASPDTAPSQGGAVRSSAADPTTRDASQDMASTQGGTVRSSAADPATRVASADMAPSQVGATRSSAADPAARVASADIASAQGATMRSSAANPAARDASQDMASAQGVAVRSSATGPATRVASADMAPLQGGAMRSSAERAAPGMGRTNAAGRIAEDRRAGSDAGPVADTAAVAPATGLGHGGGTPPVGVALAGAGPVASGAVRRETGSLRDTLPFALALILFLVTFIGLGISMWPYIIPPSVTIWDAASPYASQLFMFVGAAVLIPIILAYTAYAYWVFRGKLNHGEGYH